VLLSLAPGLFEPFAATLGLLSSRPERVAEVWLMLKGGGELPIGVAAIAKLLYAGSLRAVGIGA
jgi:hypothetical protein